MDDYRRLSMTLDEMDGMGLTADSGSEPPDDAVEPRMNRHRRRAQKHKKKARGTYPQQSTIVLRQLTECR